MAFPVCLIIVDNGPAEPAVPTNKKNEQTRTFPRFADNKEFKLFLAKLEHIVFGGSGGLPVHFQR